MCNGQTGLNEVNNEVKLKNNYFLFSMSLFPVEMLSESPYPCVYIVNKLVILPVVFIRVIRSYEIILGQILMFAHCFSKNKKNIQTR